MPASILIVDDDPNVRATLETLLRTVLELHVAAVDSGAEALRWLEIHPVQLVITDLVMPGMSGTALIREMRSRGLAAPVIVVSGHLTAFAGEAQLKEQGIAAVLGKPFGMRELLEAVLPFAGADSFRIGKPA